jgi:carotenoid cleavage dioxygenase
VAHPTDLPTATNPYLEGNFAPVREELTEDHVLPMEGAVPAGLEGLWVRNGPNPVQVPDPAAYHWFTGDGMVHAVELREGRAVSYRNRWVRTRKLAAQLDTLPPRGPAEPLDGPANTHVVWHGGRLLALVESGFPHRLSPELSTLCVEDFDGMLTSPMTAHPKEDPDTGGLAFFGYDCFGPPFLRYHELDVTGALVHTTEIDIPRATMQHDFAVTATRVVFLDLPVVFDRAMADRDPLPFRWAPEAGARLGVLDRGAPGEQVRWLDLDPCYVFHVLNAYDDGTDLVVDVCRYDRTFDTEPGELLGTAMPTLHRWRLDPATGRVEDTAVDDRPVEFPRCDARVAGRPYRHGYAALVSRAEGTDDFTGLVHYDLSRDESEVRDFGDGAPGEPIFVRGADGRSDDEGWILTVVYDPTRDASDLYILDATSFKGRPEAVIHLPARVPFGFHGSFVPIDRYR